MPEIETRPWALYGMEEDMAIKKIDCTACGGDGWLPSLPEGESQCPYCEGAGKVEDRPLPRIKKEAK
jgi:DnaJ-class molecular chaperone